MGTKHEMEHTKNPRVAKRIALDHLKEHPTYYTYLKKAERQMSLAEKKKKRRTIKMKIAKRRIKK
jgi:hypothetical protein